MVIEGGYHSPGIQDAALAHSGGRVNIRDPPFRYLKRNPKTERALRELSVIWYVWYLRYNLHKRGLGFKAGDPLGMERFAPSTVIFARTYKRDGRSRGQHNLVAQLSLDLIETP